MDTNDKFCVLSSESESFNKLINDVSEIKKDLHELKKLFDGHNKNYKVMDTYSKITENKKYLSKNYYIPFLIVFGAIFIYNNKEKLYFRI